MPSSATITATRLSSWVSRRSACLARECLATLAIASWTTRKSATSMWAGSRWAGDRLGGLVVELTSEPTPLVLLRGDRLAKDVSESVGPLLHPELELLVCLLDRLVGSSKPLAHSLEAL